MSEKKVFQIFRAGTHTAMDGRSLSFPLNTLQQVASSYNVNTHRAPLVLGHPKDDTSAPSYGYVTRMHIKGNGLFAEANVNPELIAMVKEGKYITVSAAFYTPDNASNPTKGAYYLRHVGFLGAKTPAVKGMEALMFSEETAVFSEMGQDEPNPLLLDAMRRSGVCFAERFDSPSNPLIADAESRCLDSLGG